MTDFPVEEDVVLALQSRRNHLFDRDWEPELGRHYDLLFWFCLSSNELYFVDFRAQI